jgi:vacuolar-type H+-ATPase subunit H
MTRRTSADELIDEIREIRRQIFAECGNDPKRLVEHYMEFQQQFADRLVPPPDTSGLEERVRALLSE